jgi:phenylacetate-CoA ligase
MNLARRLLNTATIALQARHERRVPFWSAEGITRRQRRHLRAIVAHAYTSVPFYADSMRELGLTPRDIRSVDDLALLPPIDAALVRADEGRFLSTRIPPARRRALHTSGSHTGQHGVVWWDDRSLLGKLAYAERDRAVLGTLLGRAIGHRQLHLLPRAAQSFVLREWWSEWTVTPRRLATRSVVPPETPYEEVAARLRAEQPDVVYSYGSYAEHFARWLAARDEVAHGARAWCYGGDGITRQGRALLERVTGARVLSTYQSTETGRLGFECERRDGWHLNVDLCAVRIVNAAGATVPAGHEGSLVVSNLHNRATVLLNYQLGDTGALADAPCACGRSLPLLRTLAGRRAETVRLADGREVSGLVLQAECMTALEGALRVQLAAEGPGRVRIRAVLLAGVDATMVARRIAEAVRTTYGDSLVATLEPVASLPETAAGKFQRVVRSAAPELR